jgi:hypothetical protein
MSLNLICLLIDELDTQHGTRVVYFPALPILILRGLFFLPSSRSFPLLRCLQTTEGKGVAVWDCTGMISSH